VERRRSGACSEAESERNDVAEPLTEAAACALNHECYARDERGLCGAERARSGRDRGKTGSAWSVAKLALVTEVKGD